MATGPDLLYANSITTGSIAASVTSVLLSAANNERNALWIYNDSVATLYVKIGSPASLTDFSFPLPSTGFFDWGPPCPRESIYGIWTSATGSAKVTQID